MFKLTGAADKLNTVIPTSKDEMAVFGAELLKSVKSGEIFISLAKKLLGTMVNLAAQTDAATASFMRLTGAYSEGGNLTNEYARVISGAERSLAVLGATEEDVMRSQAALYASYQGFTSLSKDQKKAIVEQTTVMDALGVSAGLSAQIFDSATKSLGFTDNQLVGLTETLHDTAQSLGKTTGQVAQDFGVVSKQLAFYGTDVVDVFQDLQKQSKATGLSMSDLLGVAGEAFDTFDGAASKVGRFNAILGGPYLNSIDMLNATEAERIEMITASMDASGQLFSDMSKYEQKAIAAALGVDVDVARRMFGELSAAEEMEIRNQEDMAETARKAQKAIDKLVNAFYSLVVRIDQLFTPITWTIEQFSKFADWAPGWVKVILNIGVAFGGLFAMLKGGAKTVTKVGTGMRRLGLFTQKVSKGMGDAGKPIGEMGKSLGNVGRSARNVGDSLNKMATRVIKPIRAVGSALRHPIDTFKNLKDLIKNFKMPNFGKMPGAKTFSKFLRTTQLNFQKLSKMFKSFKMPKLSLQGLGKSSKILQGFGKIVGGVAKALYPLELAWHSLMSIKDNFNLFGDSLKDGEGFIEKILGGIGALFITIGDAAARATDSLVNFGVWIANIFLPENWELPELNLAGMIQDSLANLDMGFITETFASMGQSMVDGLASMLPDRVAKWLGFGEAARAEEAEVSAIQGAENRRAKREGREAKTITAEDVDDVIITSSGKVIKPNPQDTLIAAKPGGPIFGNLAETLDAPFAALSKGLGAAANPLGALFGALGDKDDSSQGKTETPNVKVDVNVKIGEKQLTDIIIEALASPEAGKAISPFLN
tara:strand:- start:213 stop:2678 length:2466 start_codon:yes stop_codon:yes gene_type:complete